MANYTHFGLLVKTRLLGPPTRTQTWLAREVRRHTGLYVDDAYLSKVLTGQRKAPKIVQAVRDILELADECQTDEGCTDESSEEGFHDTANEDSGGSVGNYQGG